MIVGSL